MKEDRVSIITPLYNAGPYIAHAIQSVLAQTYEDWEMLIVDDRSTDESLKIARNYSRGDSRVKIFSLRKNSGAATARNVAFKEASGRFIAYLDADDIWLPRKLERQTAFMKSGGYAFSCASYEIIGDDGTPPGKRVLMPHRLDYRGFLENNYIQTVGVMADLKLIPKNLLIMPHLKRRQDAATWLRVLKAGFYCYGMRDVLARYRHTSDSLSGNKVKAARGTWRLYRKVEKLPLHYAFYCFTRYAFLAVRKRAYPASAVLAPFRAFHR